ncbi:MAG: FecR domain-containing protein [Saprospiraceae bacterium]|nr:FecR domain-containing protein [Saprospiraceae bacterium]
MKEIEYILLLQKQLNGELGPEESALLEQWLNASEENQMLATQVKQIWTKTAGYGKSFQPDLERDFQKVQARIRAENQVPMRATISRKLVRAAAVIALLITSVWGWTLYSDSNALQTFAAAETGSIQLNDGSTVWLRKGSQLQYPASLTADTREVRLQGEGFFQIKHDPSRPFIVHLENGGAVQVLGTEFDVSQEPQKTTVLVQSGKVRFSPQAGLEGLVLTAGHKAEFDHESDKIVHSLTNTLNDLAWQRGGLEFINTPLKQVVKDLEKYYSVTITLEAPGMEDVPHSAPLTNQPIEKVLESLALTHQITVEKTGETQYRLKAQK